VASESLLPCEGKGRGDIKGETDIMISCSRKERRKDNADECGRRNSKKL
jgi:hypothetical protein